MELYALEMSHLDVISGRGVDNSNSILQYV